MKTQPLKRHPDGKKILAQLRASKGGWKENRLVPPHGLLKEMWDADLGLPLAQVTGKHDGVIDEEWCKAQVFCFDASGEVILAIVENGDGGSRWAWVTKEQHSYRLTEEDAPPLQPFWPQFLVDLNAALGWGQDPAQFLHVDAFRRLMEKEQAEQMSVLEAQVMPGPAVQKRRLG